MGHLTYEEYQKALDDHRRRCRELAMRDEQIVDEFWLQETRAGYEVALKLSADKFGVTCAYVERLLQDQDEADSGNF